MKGSDNPFPSILVDEGTEPSAPAAGHQRLYIDSTSHHLSRTDSSGTAVDLETNQSTGSADPPTVVVMATIGSSPYTYTKPAGLHHVRVQICGGGGGSGGCATTSTNQGACSGHGGGGEYAEAWIDAADLGATETVTLGAGGTAGTAGNNAGGTGGTTSFGALLTAIGGGGGAGSAAKGNTAGQTANSGGAGGTGGAGTAAVQFHLDGGYGGNGQVILAEPAHLGSAGFPPVLGRQGRGGTAVSGAGGTAVGYGGGGHAATQGASQGAAVAGAAGNPGACIVTEFYS